MQFAATRHAKLVRITRFFNPQCDVVLEFLSESPLDLAAGQEFALLSREWRLVDLEGHADCRLVDFQGRQPLGCAAFADRVRYP